MLTFLMPPETVSLGPPHFHLDVSYKPVEHTLNEKSVPDLRAWRTLQGISRIAITQTFLGAR